MPQSEKQRRWEFTRYSLAGLALWLPVILARDILYQHVPAALEIPLLVVVVTGSCLLGLAAFREGIDKSRPNRSAFLLGLGMGALFFSVGLALLQEGLGQACGVVVAFWIVMMAAAVRLSSLLNGRFRASFPSPATPAPALSGEMRRFFEESASNDPDAYVIYPDRAGLRRACRQMPLLMLFCGWPVFFIFVIPAWWSTIFVVFAVVGVGLCAMQLFDLIYRLVRWTPSLILSREGMVDHASQGRRGMGLIPWDEIRGMVVNRREGEHTGSGSLMIILANPRAFRKRVSLYQRINHLMFPGTYPFLSISPPMLSVPPEDVLAAVLRYTSLLAPAEDESRLVRVPAATQPAQPEQ